jgi:hypothetical protein
MSVEKLTEDLLAKLVRNNDSIAMEKTSDSCDELVEGRKLIGDIFVGNLVHLGRPAVADVFDDGFECRAAFCG